MDLGLQFLEPPHPGWQGRVCWATPQLGLWKWVWKWCPNRGQRWEGDVGLSAGLCGKVCVRSVAHGKEGMSVSPCPRKAAAVGAGE